MPVDLDALARRPGLLVVSPGVVEGGAGEAVPAPVAGPRTAPPAGAAERALATATRWSAPPAPGFRIIGLIASARLTRAGRRPGKAAR